ncbi:MAG: 4-hydroxy-tetrahydrodipicolinate synthase [Candidatus Izemoplasmataceae bacterium]
MIFKGSGVALITPFKNGEIDIESFNKLIEFHIKSSTDALIITGTTGESATLSKEEKLLLYEEAVKTAKKRVPIIANTGTNNTFESIDLSLGAERLGVDGLLVVTPYYNKPTQKGLYAHFTAIANATALPIILYNVPSRTSVSLSLETIVELSKISNIVGIKEASGDLSFVEEIILSTPKNFALYSGNDDLYADTLRLGGDGVISVVANIVPSVSHQLFKEFQEDKENAFFIQERLNILNDCLFIESNPVPVKTALSIMSTISNEVRLPLVTLEESSLNRLKKALNTFGIEAIKL